MEAAIDFAVKKAGAPQLWHDQLAAIRAFVEGNDVFVALPTGFGKSYCFGPLPLVFDHMRGTEGSIALVVSPLTALMMEQRGKFLALAIVKRHHFLSTCALT